MSRKPFNTSKAGKFRQPKKTILLVTNGKNTEAEYISELAKYANLNPDFSVKKQYINGQPENLLEKLCSPNGDTSGYDELWLIVDEDGIDRSSFIKQCLDLSTERQKWRAIVSRPCFEVWLIAHYERVKNYPDHGAAQVHFRKLIPGKTPNKSLPSNFPFGRSAEAIDRSRLSGVPLNTIEEYPTNPGTSMPLLLERLCMSEWSSE